MGAGASEGGIVSDSNNFVILVQKIPSLQSFGILTYFELVPESEL